MNKRAVQLYSRNPGSTETGCAQLSISCDDVRFLRLPEVKALTGLSKTSLYGLIRERSFPPPVRLGARSVAWVRSEVNQWAADRVEASRAVPALLGAKRTPLPVRPDLRPAVRRPA
jgi:prophage regulatory protein